MKNSQTNLSPDCEASDLRIALVVSTYHEEVTASLHNGAVETLIDVGVSEDSIVTISVPGAFEIPLAARRAAESRSFDAIVCLGCLIRGETPHFDYIASAVANGIMMASQETGVPISFGVLTTNTLNEAKARAGSSRQTNKGCEAALAVVRLSKVFRQLTSKRSNGEKG